MEHTKDIQKTFRRHVKDIQKTYKSRTKVKTKTSPILYLTCAFEHSDIERIPDEFAVDDGE